MVATAVLGRARGALRGRPQWRPQRAGGPSRPVPAFRGVAASVAGNARRREAAELLACAARRTDRAATANGPAPARSMDRARRSASLDVLAGLVPRHQITEPNSSRPG